MNQEKHTEIFIENLDEKRKILKEIINRFLAPLPNRNIKLETQILDYVLINNDEIINSINTKININQIRNLISRSKYDIKRADDAYKDKDYNNTVYHLEQSFEKIVKAYGLFLGIIKDPHEVGHETSKVFLKMLQKSWIEKIPNFLNIDPKKSIEYLEFLKKNKEAKLELDDSVPSSLDYFNYVLRHASNKLSKREMRRVILAVKKFNGFNLKKFCMNQIYFSYFLCPFAIISSVHANDPRYSEDITDLKLIRYFPKILKILNNSIAYIEDDIRLSSQKTDITVSANLAS